MRDDLRLRATAIFNNAGGDQRFRYLQLEAHHHFARSAHGWNSGVQYQAQIPDGNDGPGRLRVAWANSFDVGENWELRAVGLIGREFGDQRARGLILETRGEAMRQLTRRVSFGVQSFNFYRSTAGPDAFNNQNHSLGPQLRSRLGRNAIIQVDALFGVSESAPDVNGRFLLQYRL